MLFNHQFTPLQETDAETLTGGGPNRFPAIQGDFGACWLMVNFFLELGLIPVYSTTERQALEEHQPGGSVKLANHFRHRIFRRYGV